MKLYYTKYLILLRKIQIVSTKLKLNIIQSKITINVNFIDE